MQQNSGGQAGRGCSVSLDQFTAVDQKERECKEHIWMLGKLFGKQVSVGILDPWTGVQDKTNQDIC